MEWSKSAISKAELEKKQKEFIEEAIKMARKAGHSAVNKEEKAPEPVYEQAVVEIPSETEIEIAEVLEELTEESEEAEEKAIEAEIEVELVLKEKAEEPDFFEAEEECAEESEEELTFGVFDAEELSKAIESGEISGDGLKQAAEILAEMTNKTEAMKKLIDEQEKKAEKADNGADYGLNSYIDRHNNSCRGCKNGNFNAP